MVTKSMQLQSWTQKCTVLWQRQGCTCSLSRVPREEVLFYFHVTFLCCPRSVCRSVNIATDEPTRMLTFSCTKMCLHVVVHLLGLSPIKMVSPPNSLRGEIEDTHGEVKIKNVKQLSWLNGVNLNKERIKRRKWTCSESTLLEKSVEWHTDTLLGKSVNRQFVQSSVLVGRVAWMIIFNYYYLRYKTQLANLVDFLPNGR